MGAEAALPEQRGDTRADLVPCVEPSEAADDAPRQPCRSRKTGSSGLQVKRAGTTLVPVPRLT